MANQHTAKKGQFVAPGPKTVKRAPVKRKTAAVARGAAKVTRAAPARRTDARDTGRSPLEQLFPSLKFVNLGDGGLARLMRDIVREGADQPVSSVRQDVQIRVADETYASALKSTEPVAEIPATVEQLQAALNSLSNTLGLLADRLEPVLKPADTKAASGDGGGANRSTQVGMQLQSCFGQVEHIAYRAHDLLHRLAL